MQLLISPNNLFSLNRGHTEENNFCFKFYFSFMCGGKLYAFKLAFSACENLRGNLVSILWYVIFN